MAVDRRVIAKELWFKRYFDNLRSSVVGGFMDWLRSFSTLLRASLTVSIWPFMLLKNFLFPSSPSSPLRPSAAVWKTLHMELKIWVAASWWCGVNVLSMSCVQNWKFELRQVDDAGSLRKGPPIGKPWIQNWKFELQPVDDVGTWGHWGQDHLLESWRSWLSSWRLCCMSAALEESPILLIVVPEDSREFENLKLMSCKRTVSVTRFKTL